MPRAVSLRRLKLAHHARWLLWFRESPPSNLAVEPAMLARIREQMLTRPLPLDRPIVVIAGFADPGIYAALVARELRRLTSRSKDDFILPKINPFADITESAARVVGQTRAALTRLGLDPDTQVDMVGMSMGGLVCRAAASPIVDKPLRINNLFTLGTPHAGAEIAQTVSPSIASDQMKPNSAFLERLNAHRVPDRTFCFTMRGDKVIGADRGVAPSADEFRLPGRPGEDHLHIMGDPLALMQIARILRNEPNILNPEER